MSLGFPPFDGRPAWTGRADRDRPGSGIRWEEYLAAITLVGALCITLLQYSQCTYQPMSSPPWSVDPWLIASGEGNGHGAVAIEVVVNG